LKAAPVSLRRYPVAWYCFAVTRQRPVTDGADYWAFSRLKGGWRTEFAGHADPEDWLATAQVVLGVSSGAPHELLAYHDRGDGRHRFAAFDGDTLAGALFLAREPVAVARTWIGDRLGETFASPRERLALLAGRAGAHDKDRGAIVCACFDVGANDIVEAITRGGCCTVDAVGRALKAGTNCGSCRAEIGRLIHEHAIKEAV
jgi:assimilatory nitrate reductase catalytic subunit